MRAMLDRLIRFFLFAGEWLSDTCGVTRENNRDPVRMVVNYLFWGLATVGFPIWSYSVPVTGQVIQVAGGHAL
ncbi:hypothetical protein [Mesorhizobium sp.]|uniref:hypothetical protein n=1 Tax=Mesorhizobium sp. TaxID=1871066 RepID=UPI000FE98934|nr:hypothetical protein [Mesorhizobium sp.]RWC30896.1 MAG: hypothetical protein EOS27_12225 [Mesorhizobium sp.]TIX27995.1 MAG: hypothetical protein E5V35_03990 [Mesorhizobium sp.]